MSANTGERPDAIQQAAQMLRTARHAIALTGAGFSTPSGIPDFRTAGSGLWARYLPMQVASLSTFRYDPEMFFEWLRPLASHMLFAQPNPAHYALAELEARHIMHAIITQNIDGLHQRAGSKHVYEVHGTFTSLTCASCFHKYPSQGLIEPYLAGSKPPRCPKCNHYLKPDVILFEEQLPVLTWHKAEKACRQCDLLLVAGTSLEVLPSASLPVKALDHGARLILLNKTETYIDVRADLIFREDIAEILPKITRLALQPPEL